MVSIVADGIAERLYGTRFEVDAAGLDEELQIGVLMVEVPPPGVEDRSPTALEELTA